MRQNQAGSLLIGIVFAMLIMALMAVAGVSMLVNQTHIALDVQAIAQSHALAEGGSKYVLRQLADDTDWSDGVTLHSETMLGGYPFTATYSNATRNRIRVTVKSQIGFGDSVGTHSYSFRAWRMPKAAYYSLFWPDSGNEGMTLTNVTLKGPVYLGGSVTTTGTTHTHGMVYHKQGTVISAIAGTDAKSLRGVSDPQPVMPLYDTATTKNRYENAAISVYQPAIASAHNTPSDADLCPTSSSDLSISNDFTVPTGETTCRDIYISAGADITISGTGRLVAWRHVYFQGLPIADSCRYNDANFRSSDGGCKKVTSPSGNLVWSRQLTDATQATAAAACTALGAGFALPTSTQLTDAREAGAINTLPYLSGQPLPGDMFWSSTAGGAGGQSKTVEMATMGAPTVDKLNTTTQKVLCVHAASVTTQGNTIISPSGGPIEIIAGGSMLKTDDRKGLWVKEGANANERVTLFAANSTLTGLSNLPLNTGSQSYFAGTTYSGMYSKFEQPLIMSTRNLRLVSGMKVYNDGILYLRDYSNVAAERNFLDVIDLGTAVDGSVISVSRRDPGLRLVAANVTGMVYSRGTTTEGRAYVTDSVINGSFIANLISGNTIANSTIDNTDPTWYPSTNIPDGFSLSASVEPGSWDGQ